MYEPRFPKDFPSVGVWTVTYFDEYEENHPLKRERVFVSEHMGRWKLLRRKVKYGWDYALGEMDKYLMRSSWKGDSPYFSGQWHMYTNDSVIHVVSACR